MTDPNTDPNTDPTPDAPLTRRALLRAAVGLAGALALGLEAAPARADLPALDDPDAGAPPALAFWDGAQLQDPARMSADRVLAGRALRGASVRLTLHSRPAGGPPTLHALTAHFPVRDGAETRWTPFLAWAASPGAGGQGIAFTMPIHPVEGLRLSVELGEGPRGDVRSAECRLGLAGGGAALRAGTYLIAPTGTDWTGCTLAGGERLSAFGGGPVGFDHLLLTVGPA